MNRINVSAVIFLTVILCSNGSAALSKSIEEVNNEIRDSTPYGRYMHAAEVADKQGNNAEAQTNFSAALSEAEKLDAKERPRKQTLSLLGLARVYARQGKNADAEALYKRALAIAEKPVAADPEEAAVFGKLNLPAVSSPHSEQLMQTTVLFQYADFLRKTNRTAEASQMDARCKAARDKFLR